MSEQVRQVIRHVEVRDPVGRNVAALGIHGGTVAWWQFPAVWPYL
jgi:hypothetical protein